MCCTRLAANIGRKKVAKNRHLCTIAQLCRAISFFLLFLSIFFTRLFSAIADWMSIILVSDIAVFVLKRDVKLQLTNCLPYFHTSCGLSVNLGCRSEMCCMQLAENTGCKKSPKIRHLGTIALLCRAVSSQLRHISTIRKTC